MCIILFLKCMFWGFIHFLSLNIYLLEIHILLQTYAYQKWPYIKLRYYIITCYTSSDFHAEIKDSELWWLIINLGLQWVVVLILKKIYLLNYSCWTIQWKCTAEFYNTLFYWYRGFPTIFKDTWNKTKWRVFSWDKSVLLLMQQFTVWPQIQEHRTSCILH